MDPARPQGTSIRLGALDLPSGFDHERFEIRSALGRGTSSTVYRTFDRQRGAEVALKVLKPDLLRDDDAVSTFVDEARITKVKGDIQMLETALSMYRLDTARFPTTDQGLVALVKKPDDPSVRNWKSGGYLSRVSKDPWGNDYRYAYPGQRGREYDLYSVGPDGQEGTEDTDKDNVGNWNLDE